MKAMLLVLGCVLAAVALAQIQHIGQQFSANGQSAAAVCPCDGWLSNDASVTLCYNGRCSLQYNFYDYERLMKRIFQGMYGV